MDKIILRLIYGIVIGIVSVAYAGVVIWAGQGSLKVDTEPTTIPEALTAVATGVGGVLATNFGAFLGITAVAGGLSFGRARETL